MSTYLITSDPEPSKFARCKGLEYCFFSPGGDREDESFVFNPKDIPSRYQGKLKEGEYVDPKDFVWSKKLRSNVLENDDPVSEEEAREDPLFHDFRESGYPDEDSVTATAVATKPRSSRNIPKKLAQETQIEVDRMNFDSFTEINLKCFDAELLADYREWLFLQNKAAFVWSRLNSRMMHKTEELLRSTK